MKGTIGVIMTIEEKIQEIFISVSDISFLVKASASPLLNPKKYKKILELGNTPDTSMAKILKKYKPFLLSYLVTEKSLKEAKILGMPGDIEDAHGTGFSVTLQRVILSRRQCSSQCVGSHPGGGQLGFAAQCHHGSHEYAS